MPHRAPSQAGALATGAVGKHEVCSARKLGSKDSVWNGAPLKLDVGHSLDESAHPMCFDTAVSTLNPAMRPSPTIVISYSEPATPSTVDPSNYCTPTIAPAARLLFRLPLRALRWQRQPRTKAILVAFVSDMLRDGLCSQPRRTSSIQYYFVNKSLTVLKARMGKASSGFKS